MVFTALPVVIPNLVRSYWLPIFAFYKSIYSFLMYKFTAVVFITAVLRGFYWKGDIIPTIFITVISFSGRVYRIFFYGKYRFVTS